MLKLAFLFFAGSVSGWVLELLFRRFLSSANPERRWINQASARVPMCRSTAWGSARSTS